MIEPKNRPNHAYDGTHGLDDDEKQLLDSLVSVVKNSNLSFESVNTVLIVMSDALYSHALRTRMDFQKQDDHADTSKNRHE